MSYINDEEKEDLNEIKRFNLQDKIGKQVANFMRLQEEKRILANIKKRIKKIKTMDELEEYTAALEDAGVVPQNYIAKLKAKKKRKLQEERFKMSQAINNQFNQIQRGKIPNYPDKDLYKEERTPENDGSRTRGSSQKDKERQRSNTYSRGRGERGGR